jgi:RHS repeat-associated protein
MKRVVLASIFFLTFFSTLSQSPNPPVVLVPLPGAAGIVPKIIPPSPEASALAKYVEWPVNLAAGTPDINIPIHTISKGPIALNISINYHASGIRVDEIATWVGSGWSLNAGGAITRTLRGRPDDDKTKGFLDYTINKTPSTLSEANYYDVSDGCLETQPDLFNLNVNGLNAQMVFDWNGQGIKYNSTSTLIITYVRNLTTGYITSWQIIDDKGITYTFAEMETSNNAGPGVTGCAFYNNYPSAWYLSSIKDENADHIINFVYDDYAYQTINTSHTYKNGIGLPLFPCLAVNTMTTNTSLNTIQGKRIKEIHADDLTQNVFFNKSIADRQDTGGLNGSIVNSNFKYLESIDIKNLDNSPKTSFVLGYDNLPNSRLTLKAIQPKANSQNSSPPYSFEYNQVLPPVGSFSQDHWGYYNGVTNPHLIPSGDNFYFLDQYGITSREPNAQTTLYGILNKIIYPTGASTFFEFEAHNYQTDVFAQLISPKVAGGARIKRQKLFENDGLVLTKEYRYEYFTPNGTSSGVLMTNLRYNYDTEVYCTDATNQFEGSAIHHVRTSSSINGAGSNHIAYSHVQMYQVNGSTTNGKTESIFTVVPPTIISGPPLMSSFTNHYNSGLLTNQKDYSLNNSNYSLVKEITNTYQNFEVQIPVFAAIFQGGIYYSNTNGNHFITCQYNSILGISKLSTSTIKEYFGSGNITNTTQIQYSPNGRYVKKETRSGNQFTEQYITEYFYPFEYLQPDPSVTSLLSKNHIRQALEIVLKKSNNSIENVIAAANTKYSLFASKIRVSNLSKLDINTPLSPGVFDYAFDNNAGAIDSRYTLEAQINAYDSRGNIIEVAEKNNPLMAYYYAYNLSEPVCHAQNVSSSALNVAISNAGLSLAELSVAQPTLVTKQKMQAVQTDLPGAFVSWYGFEPMVGLTFNKAINGLETSFEYDVNNRLFKIKDHENNLIEQIEYEIANNNNKIRKYYPRVASLTLAVGLPNLSTQISHFDNLGRATQTNNLKASPDTQTDIVSNATTYDAYGRPARSYIPYAYNSNGGVAPLPTSVHGDSKPYSYITEYDNSPLNRPLTSLGVGEAWHNNNKTNTIIYDIATSVPLFTTNSTGANLSGTYAINLYKTTQLDEQGNASFEIKDLDGKLIQKAVEESLGNFLVTHYIYDIFDRLAYIIQPEGYANLQSFTEASIFFTNYVFAYHYDIQGRPSEKHVPAGGWTRYIYDRKDRPVLEQNAHQAILNRWNFVKYDVHNREVFRGETTNSNSPATLQTAFNTHLNPDETWATGSGYSGTSFPAIANPSGNDVQHYTFYDSYDFVSALNNNLTFDATNTYHPRHNSATALQTGVLSYNSSDHNLFYLNTSYFDTKNRPIQSFNTHLLSTTLPNRMSMQYNFSGELLKLKTLHRKTGASDIIITDSTYYDHTGRTLKKLHGINTSSLEILRFEYDNVGRMIQKKYLPNSTFLTNGSPDYITRPPSPTNAVIDIAKKAINLNPGTVISPNYMGYINPNATGDTPILGLQTVDYKYHIRGWLQGINFDANNNPVPNTSQGDLFSYKLDYETMGFFDGNIAKQTWASTNFGNTTVESRSYTHTYDRSSRLKSSSYVGIGQENYSMPSISYDKNGNIINLQRKGLLNTNSYGDMDNLSYNYTGNKLNTITDAIISNNEVDFVPRGNNSYTYWSNGNLKSDANENIDNISYNSYLNQPNIVLLADKRSVSTTYDGSGTVLKNTYSNGETWEYAGSLIYKNGLPYQMATPDGRATFMNNTWQYEFDYKDHIGNTRVSFKAENGALVKTGEKTFDPWGVVLRGLGSQNGIQNRWELQDHEKESTFGLNRINFGNRVLNPTIGRFDKIDPLADHPQQMRYSPYVFSNNNPIRFTDPDGRLPIDDYYDNQTAKYLGSDGASTTNSRLISASSYNQISQTNGGTTSTTATSSLQGDSKIITINEGQINSTLQGVRDNSRSSGVEHSAYLALNPETATISAVVGPTGSNGKTEMEYERPAGTSFMASGETNQVTGLSILIGQAHGHPLTQDAGMVNERGTSDLDKDASRNSGVPIYSIDSYSGKKIGGVGSINRVTPDGIQTNGVGKTIGTGTIGNFNIGLDALQRSGGKIK